MKTNDELDLAIRYAKSLDPLFKAISTMPPPRQAARTLRRHFRYRVCQSCWQEFEPKADEHICRECVQCCDSPDVFTARVQGDDACTLTTKACRNCGKRWDIES